MISKPQRETLGGRVVLLTVLALALIFGGLYTAAYAFAGEKVPEGVTVAGIEIGGLTHDDAVAKLEAGFAERARLEANVDGEPVTLNAAGIGLSVDYEATVDEAGGGRSWSPGRLWDYYTGGDDLEPVLIVDETRFEAALSGLDRSFGNPPREGDVTFRKGEVVTKKAANGTGIDRSNAREQIEDAYFGGDDADLTLVPAEPSISDDDVQQALNKFANAAVSAPVVLDFEEARVRLTPREYSRVLDMVARDGKLVPELDEERFADLLDSRIVGLEGAPVDATVRLVNGRPRVVPDKPGIGFDMGQVSSQFLDVVARTNDRVLEAKGEVKRAEFRTKDARALKITERVSTFTTYYPHEDYRNTNIGRAAELVNGTLLKPGETFSLNDTVGERTEENGFTTGYIIQNGILIRDLGGGVSQMATTTFNAAFFAGLKDVEHKPHSFYIDRYPVGREATVAWGAVDLRFTNNTPYGILISANVTPSTFSSYGVVTVSMWSTKFWEISSITGDRYNFTEEKTRTLYGPECVPNDGFGGFDIDVTRVFRRPGSSEVVKRENFHTRYIPSDTVICKAASEDPANQPDEDDE